MRDISLLQLRVHLPYMRRVAMWDRIQRSRSAKSLRPLQWHPAQAKRAIRMLLTNLTGHAHLSPHWALPHQLW